MQMKEKIDKVMLSYLRGSITYDEIAVNIMQVLNKYSPDDTDDEEDEV